MRFDKSKWKNVLKAQKKAAIKEAERRQIREFVNSLSEEKLKSYGEMLAKQRKEEEYNASHYW